MSCSNPFADVKAVYFDLDDTLCAYWIASKAALRSAFEQHGPDGYTPEEMIGHWAGAFRDFSPRVKRTDLYAEYLKSGTKTRTEQMRLALERVSVDDTPRAEALSHTYMTLRDANLKLFDESLDVLNHLYGRYPLGLMTNGPADIQRQEVNTLNIERFFDHIYIEGEVGFGKPVPELFRMAEQAVGFPPEQILFVGNSYRHDIEPAILAGWKTFWVRRASDIPPSAPGIHPMPEDRPEGAPRPDLEESSLTPLLTLL
ncbi:MAG: HAD family hydrolase [Fimbriimonadaceae bacterium]|nr:HAD family hydrolase [Fimbriimonadaceae bacterium]